MVMKNKLYIILLSAVGIFFSSCEKFLDKNPKDSVSPNDYYKTQGDLERAITGVYDRLGDNSLYGTTLWSYLCFSDDFFFRASTTGLRANMLDAGDAAVNGLFERCYVGVERANLLLDNIDNATASQSVKDEIKGQALFLRAYYYFLLVDNFGGIPLRLKPTTSPNDQLLPRSTVKEVYDQIVMDMKASIHLLKPISAYPHNGKVTKTAAQGILARVYLTMAGAPLNDASQYQNAREMAQLVIQSGLHSLNPDYSQIFINHSKDAYDKAECLWEVEFAGNGMDIYKESGALGSYLGVANTADLEIGYADDNVHTTGKLFNAYDSRDSRRDWAIAPYRFTGNPGVKTFWNATQIYDRSAGKWRRDYEVVLPKGRGATPTNFPLLRYSDVLLMYAEADNEIQGPQALAIEYVNQVRKRGWGERLQTITITNQGSGYTVAPAVTITGGGRPPGAIEPSGARATATIVGGRVTAITIIDPGVYYTTAPTVTIAPPPSGIAGQATATSSITNDNAANSALTTMQTADKDALRTEIRNERYREFAFEGIRKHDLLRWGVYSKTMSDLEADINTNAPAAFRYASIAASYAKLPKYILFPIPNSELSLNKNISQNPNW